MGAVMTKPHPLPHLHMLNNAYPVPWKPHAKFTWLVFLLAFESKTTSCGCDYGQTTHNMEINAYPVTWRPHAKFWPLVQGFVRDGYTHTLTHPPTHTHPHTPHTHTTYTHTQIYTYVVTNQNISPIYICIYEYEMSVCLSVCLYHHSLKLSMMIGFDFTLGVTWAGSHLATPLCYFVEG